MIFLYDTCSLLINQTRLAQSDEHFYISSITLFELENIKTSQTKSEETKYNARKLLHWLDENEDRYNVVVYTTDMSESLDKLGLPQTPDSRIIACAKIFCEADWIPGDKRFYTDDLNCKSIAKYANVPVYESKSKTEEEYTGYKIINDLESFYSEEFNNPINKYNLYTNEYLLLEENGKIIDKYRWDGTQYQAIPYHKFESKMFGKVCPKDNDPYQLIAMDNLIHNQISMLRGPAGSGKSYLSFGYMFSLLERGAIDKIIVFCNTVATNGSAKLGYYPGSRTEKLLDSQIGNLLTSKLGDRYIVEKMIEDGDLVLLPMSDIRGYDTTGMNAAVYISEAQNLDIELMRLALQRIGEDSICILDGDSNTQVDLAMYAGDRNGMRRVSTIFKGSEFYGEVTLKNIKRSKIAELAQKM